VKRRARARARVSVRCGDRDVHERIIDIAPLILSLSRPRVIALQIRPARLAAETRSSSSSQNPPKRLTVAAVRSSIRSRPIESSTRAIPFQLHKLAELTLCRRIILRALPVRVLDRKLATLGSCGTKRKGIRAVLAPSSNRAIRGCLPRDRRSSEVVVSPRGSFHHEARHRCPAGSFGGGAEGSGVGNTCCCAPSLGIGRVHREGARSQQSRLEWKWPDVSRDGGGRREGRHSLLSRLSRRPVVDVVVVTWHWNARVDATRNKAAK